MSTLLNNRILRMIPRGITGLLLAVVFRWMAVAAEAMLLLSLASTLAAAVEQGISLINTTYVLLISLICVVDYVAFQTFFQQACFELGSRALTTLRTAALGKLVDLDAGGPSGASSARLAVLLSEDLELLRSYLSNCLPQFFFAVAAALSLSCVLFMHSWLVALVLLIGACLTLVVAIFSRSMLLLDITSCLSIVAGIGVTVLQLTQDAIMPFGAFAVVLLSPLFVTSIRAFAQSWWECSSAPAVADRLIALLTAPTQDYTGTEVAKDALPKLSVDALAWAADTGLAVEIQPVVAQAATAQHGRHFRADSELYADDAHDTSPDHTVSFSVVGNGLVALSGDGANSVVRVLAGEVPSYEGSVRICDTELRELSFASLHGALITIDANAQVFMGTIRSNLLLAYPNASDADLLDALRALRLNTLILDEDGLDGEVWQGGSNLSVARCRALCLARAAFCDAPIYLLDDVGRDLDEQSLHQLARAVHELARRAIVVATPQAAPTLVLGATTVDVGQSGAVYDPAGHAFDTPRASRDLPLGAHSLDDVLLAWDCWDRLLQVTDQEQGEASQSAASSALLPFFPPEFAAGDRAVAGATAGTLISRFLRFVERLHKLWSKKPEGRTASFSDTAGVQNVGKAARQPRSSVGIRAFFALAFPSLKGAFAVLALQLLASLAIIAVPTLSIVAVLTSMELLGQLQPQLAIGMLGVSALLVGPSLYGARHLVSVWHVRSFKPIRDGVVAALGYPLPANAVECFDDAPAARSGADLERLEHAFVKLPAAFTSLLVELIIVVATATQSLLLACIMLCAYLGIICIATVRYTRPLCSRDDALHGYAVLLAGTLADAVHGMADLIRLDQAQAYVQELTARLESFAQDEREGSSATAARTAAVVGVALASIALAMLLILARVGLGAMQPVPITICVVAFVASLSCALDTAQNIGTFIRSFEPATRIYAIISQ